MIDSNDGANHSTSESEVNVHFSGTWSEEEQSLIHSAIQTVEPVRDLDSFTGYTWICTKVDVEDDSHFFATRIKSSEVLRSTTANALADRIRERWD